MKDVAYWHKMRNNMNENDEIVIDTWSELTKDVQKDVIDDGYRIRPIDSRLANEEEHLIKRWDVANLLKGVRAEDKGVVAVMLENQRLHNETCTDTGDIAQFKRISVPLVRRITGGWFASRLVSTQVMLGPTAIGYYANGNMIDSTVLTSKISKFKTVWCYEMQQDLRSQHNLDTEAQLTAVIAEEISMEFDRMVVTKLIEAAAHRKTVKFDRLTGDKMDRVKSLIGNMVDEGAEMYDAPRPTYIVTSPNLAESLISTFRAPRATLRMSYAGEWEGVQVYCDPLLSPGSVLMGRRGNGYDAGAILAPYVMLMQTPVVLDPNTFMPIKGLLSRYDFKVVDDRYYSYLNVEGFKTDTEEFNPIVV